jgi:hypothetical protein
MHIQYLVEQIGFVTDFVSDNKTDDYLNIFYGENILDANACVGMCVN